MEAGVFPDELEERAVGVLGMGDEEAEVLVGQLLDLSAAGERHAHAVIEQVLGESADVLDPEGDVDEVRAVALEEAGRGRVAVGVDGGQGFEREGAAHEVGAVAAALEFEELRLVDPASQEVVVELARFEHVGDDVRAVEELDDLVHGPSPGRRTRRTLGAFYPREARRARGVSRRRGPRARGWWAAAYRRRGRCRRAPVSAPRGGRAARAVSRRCVRRRGATAF